MKSIDHYIQDAGEKYFVMKVCEALREINRLNESDDLTIVRRSFMDYCNNRNCLDVFMDSEYRKIYDAHILRYVSDLIGLFQHTSMFSVRDIEKVSRDNGKKADFEVVVYDADKPIRTFNQSLKAYKTDNGVQLCSGTFLSTICSLIMENRGVGKFVNPSTGTVFSSRNIAKLMEVVRSCGPEIQSAIQKVLHIQNIVKSWKTDPTKEIYSNIQYTGADGNTYNNNDDSAWKTFCHDVGVVGQNQIAAVARCIDQSQLKRFFGKSTGMTGAEELLILCGENVYINSLTNPKLKTVVQSFNDEKSVITVSTNDNKGVTFCLVTKTNQIVFSAYMPTTINKNGMWQLDDIGGRVLSKKKFRGVFIEFGRRRPDKLEIATSTNCWVDLKKYLL